MQIYLKVMIDTEDQDERAEKLGAELCRQAMRVYGVRSAEVTAVTEEE